MANTLKFGNGTWATKKGSTLAFNDEDGNYKPLPFTTTRASSATRVNKEGLIEVVEGDRPRIDYTDSADGALLLEPTRSNLITYSEDFSQWTNDRVTVSENQIISPNGTLNADLIAENSENSIHRIYIGSITLTDNVDYTITVFAKKGNSKVIQLTPTSTSAIGSGRANFDLENGVLGVVSGGTAEIKDYGNGWYRCSYSFEALATATSAISVNLVNDDLNALRNVNYLGNINNNVYLWGAQLETNSSYATSYIPTQGSTVTRVADTASGAGNSEVFNDSEGVLFANHNYENINPNWSGLGIMDSDGTVDRVIFAVQNNTQDFKVYLQSGGVVRWNPTIVIDVTKYQKVAVKYKSNDNALWINGFEVATDNTVSIMPSGLHKLSYFGYASLEPTYGSTKEIGYYDTALTDEELEYMTSYRSLNELVTELNLKAL